MYRSFSSRLGELLRSYVIENSFANAMPLEGLLSGEERNGEETLIERTVDFAKNQKDLPKSILPKALSAYEQNLDKWKNTSKTVIDFPLQFRI